MNQNSSIPYDFNPNTSDRIHKKQRLWQILVPILFTALISLVTAILLVLKFSQFEKMRELADAALVFMALVIGILLILFLAVVVTMSLLLKNWRDEIPPIAKAILLTSLRVKHGTRSAADMASEPVLKFNQSAAGIRGLRDSILHMKK